MYECCCVCTAVPFFSIMWISHLNEARCCFVSVRRFISISKIMAVYYFREFSSARVMYMRFCVHAKQQTTFVQHAHEHGSVTERWERCLCAFCSPNSLQTSSDSSIFGASSVHRRSHCFRSFTYAVRKKRRDVFTTLSFFSHSRSTVLSIYV